MTAQWMKQKRLKQIKERRAWARPFSIKSSAGPNWHNGSLMKIAPANPEVFLSEEIKARNQRMALNVHGQDVNRIPEMAELKHTPLTYLREITEVIPDPFFTTIVDTPFHRCRVFWNSQRNVFILQYELRFGREVRVSIAYPTFTRANQVFQEDKVRWKKSLKF